MPHLTLEYTDNIEFEIQPLLARLHSELAATGAVQRLRSKEVCSKGTTLGTQTGSEAAMRAMSVLGNAKSNCHRKTHRVEPEGAGRMFMHLTRGGPRPAGLPRGPGRDRLTVRPAARRPPPLVLRAGMRTLARGPVAQLVAQPAYTG